jgi:hypothetical protein
MGVGVGVLKGRKGGGFGGLRVEMRWRVLLWALMVVLGWF